MKKNEEVKRFIALSTIITSSEWQKDAGMIFRNKKSKTFVSVTLVLSLIHFSQTIKKKKIIPALNQDREHHYF